MTHHRRLGGLTQPLREPSSGIRAADGRARLPGEAQGAGDRRAGGTEAADELGDGLPRRSKRLDLVHLGVGPPGRPSAVPAPGLGRTATARSCISSRS